MKRLIVLLYALVLATGCELRPPASDRTAPGSTPSGIERTPVIPTSGAAMEYIQGGQGGFSMSSLKGRVAVLDLCAPWSAASRALVPELNRLHTERQAAGLAVIGLVVDASAGDGVTPELQEMGARYPLVAAPREGVLRLSGVRSVPARLLFDRKGQLRKQYAGDVSVDALRADIAELINE